MLKISAIIFCLLFAFMSGVILGAKKERAQSTENQTYSPAPSSKEQDSLKIPPFKKISLKVSKDDVSENGQGELYTVVLASFSSAESAIKHVKNIKRQGFRPFYFTKEISGKTWHRVGMGSFKLKRDALKLQKDLSENKFAKGSLISKITVNNQ